MPLTLCNLFTPFQNRVGDGQQFADFQETTFGTLKTIPLDGVELSRLMLAIAAIEKKFDIDTKHFFNTPEEWITLEKKLKETYFADNQDQAGLHGWLQNFMKTRTKRKIFENVHLELKDVMNFGVIDDMLTVGKFIERIGEQELGAPTNFVRLLRAVSGVSFNTIDFFVPHYIHMAIMFLPIHEFFMIHDVSEFVPLLNADLGAPPFRVYKSDPLKDQYQRNGTSGTGQVAHSPSFDQTEIILCLIKHPYDAENAYKFTQHRRGTMSVSASDTKTKMKSFIAQLRSSPSNSFVLVSEECCKIDFMKLSEVKNWLTTTYYTSMGDLQAGNASLEQKMIMSAHIVRSFRGGFENLAVWEVGLKLFETLFPKRTATSGLRKPAGFTGSDSYYAAELASAQEFFKSGVWSPTNCWTSQPCAEWDRIMRDFNVTN